MTITSTPSKVEYATDGVTTTFAIPFPFDTSADIGAYLTDADGNASTVTTGFSISGGGGGTGSMVFTTAPSTNQTLTISDELQITQDADYSDNDAFPAAAHENALDRQARISKRLSNKLDRAPLLPVGDELLSGGGLQIPALSERSGYFAAWDANGQFVPASGTGSDTALRADLAAEGGSSLVGIKQSVTGAVSRSVLSKLRDFANVKDFGAVGDGTVSGGTGTDNASAFATADDSGHTVVVSGDQIYRISSNLTITSALLIDSAKISIDSGVTLTLNGPLEVRNSSAPFVGPGFVAYSSASRPGRLQNIAPDFSSGVPLRGGGQYHAFGDSYTSGTGVSSSKRYATILASRWNATENNHGVGARGVTRATLEGFTNLPKYGARNCVITHLAGFNDLHYGTTNPKTLVKITSEVRAFLANAFLKYAVPANDSTVTKTGTWNNATVGVWGEKASSSFSSGRAMYSNTNADKVSYTFTGTSVVAGYYQGANSTYTLCEFDVYIDSALVETISPNNTTDGNVGFVETYEGLTHAALVYTGLGGGSHTIELRMKSSNYMMVDYFGTLSAPGDCPSVLVGEIPFVNAAGYASPELGRSKTLDLSGSAAIRASVYEFQKLGYPVAWVPVNDYYDYQTNIQSDNDHPEVAGHAQIADAFSAYTQSQNYGQPPSCTFLKSATQSVASSTLTAVTFSSALDDFHGFRDGANTSRIYAPFSGTMRLTGVVVLAGNITYECDAAVYVNGSLVALCDTAANRTAVDTVLQVDASFPVVSGDYAEVKVSQNNAGAVNLQTTCRVTAEIIR